MSLSRKHYVGIAGELRPLVRSGQVDETVLRRLARYFYEDNDRFDGDRFLQACGLGVNR